jgi:SAM-dependent methyltransferase
MASNDGTPALCLTYPTQVFVRLTVGIAHQFVCRWAVPTLQVQAEKHRMSQSVLTTEYRNRFTGLEAYREQVWQVLTGSFFNRFIRSSDTVLDLGAGWGEFIRNVRCGEKFAMDLNPDTDTRVGEGVKVILQDCSDEWLLQDNSLDVVFTSNFFEHLPNKSALERTLAEAKRCLKPGGRLICLGPNIRFIGGAYWDFWDHHVALTERSLEEVLKLEGFEISECIDRFLPYSMSQGSTPPMAFLKLYLKLPFAWKFFGKQFLVVAKKPS